MHVCRSIDRSIYSNSNSQSNSSNSNHDSQHTNTINHIKHNDNHIHNHADTNRNHNSLFGLEVAHAEARGPEAGELGRVGGGEEADLAGLDVGLHALFRFLFSCFLFNSFFSLILGVSCSCFLV